MPSQPPDPGWNFGSVYDLIDTVPHNVGSPALRAETRSPKNLEGGVGLGNFGKLWESLGLPASASVPPLPVVDESDLSNSDDALLPSPVLGVVDKHPKQDDDVPVKATEEIAPTPLTKKQRQRARKQAEKVLQDQIAKDELSDPTAGTVQDNAKQVIILSPTKATKSPATPIRAQSNVGAKMRAASPVRPRSPTKAETLRSPIKLSGAKTHKRSKSNGFSSTPKPPVQAQVQLPSAAIAQDRLPTTPPALQHHIYSQFVPLQPFSYSVPHGHNLIPSTVRPTSISRSAYTNALPVPATPSPAPPPYLMHPPQPTFTIRSQVDRHFNLFNKLLSQFPDDRKWLVAPRQLVNESTTPEGVHVFVDASNIMFGFQDMLRNIGLQPLDMSFDSLALLMERRRPVAKRVFVGSHREANPLPQVSKLVETSKAVGYECNVQEQVYIVREQSEKKKFFNDVKRVGWHKATQLRTGSGSDSETGPAIPKTPSAPKWVEQGVDELLHLKMCQSIIDTEQPTTMVLATGDGAAAEMSDGFLAHVERALRNGWQVELITWRQQTNGGYKRKTFRQKWGEQFKIIELDDFLEDLVDTP